MITDKLKITEEILKENTAACGDKGSGIFLNDVSQKLYPLGVDFTIFNPECWTRCRRHVLERNPELDKRTVKTKEMEDIVKSEVA